MTASDLNSSIRSIPTKMLFSLATGPVLFFGTLYYPFTADLSPEALAVLASTLWIASWWILEPIPIPVTSLLPIILLPLSGALSVEATTAAYGNPVIFLFLGGFILAIAMEVWNLHKRIALTIIRYLGTNQPRIVLGFMCATGVLSMWISNTATAMMMLPIGIALVKQFEQEDMQTKSAVAQPFGKALMLGIAYSASIGGLGTLIGTPANAIFAAIAQQLFRIEVSFFQWLVMGAPLAFLLLLLCWVFLVKLKYRLPTTPIAGTAEIEMQLRALGPVRTEEKWIIGIFTLTALAWISRSFILTPIFPFLDDSLIALLAALTLFLLPAPAHNYRQGLLTWQDAEKLPWGILLLFGGGLAIAAAFKTSGLAAYIGTNLSMLQGLPLLLILLVLITSVNFLTEITSNTATATMMLPIMAALAQAIGVHPYGLMLAVCLASSCAFMLPVATPPNAVVFGTGLIRMKDMVQTGLWLNALSILIITLYLYFITPILWNINLNTLPDWLTKP